jgi:CubicO group peptidase (beta-lactamase class C family)
VVGLLNPEGRSFAVYGRISIGGQEPTADTIFEIGSITKVFTAFLLADMVERGEVALNDPVRKYLPASVVVPSRRGKEILLVDLATHTSGLPRDSVEVDLNSGLSPYDGYTPGDLYAFLRSYRLGRDPGTQPEYSNVGMGLLGHALELRAGVSYEELLRRRIFEPLGMTSTTITVDGEQRSRRATGYNARRLPVPPWNGGVIAPAGGINSTAADMLKFGAAVIDSQSPLKAVFARMTSVKRPTEESRVQQTLGWNLFRLGANEIIAHSGGTFGFESRLIVDITRKRPVIAWVNGRSGGGVSDLVGLALDRARLPLSPEAGR